MYYDIYKTSERLNDKLMLELDFVLKVNTAATRHLVSMEKEQGEIDFGDAWEKWQPIFKEIVKKELEKRKMGRVEVPEEAPPPPPGRVAARPSVPPKEEKPPSPPAAPAKPPPPKPPAKKPAAKKPEKKLSLKERLRQKKLKAKKKKK